MSENWEKAYPERINWVNRVTPLNDVNLNKMDSALKTIDERVVQVGIKNTYDLLAANWEIENESSHYPYYYRIPSEDYDINSSPDAVVYTPNPHETEEEHASIEMVGKVWCDASGVTVYATNRPTVDLKLQLKGK